MVQYFVCLGKKSIVLYQKHFLDGAESYAVGFPSIFFLRSTYEHAISACILITTNRQHTTHNTQRNVIRIDNFCILLMSKYRKCCFKKTNLILLKFRCKNGVSDVFHANRSVYISLLHSKIFNIQ